MPRLCTGLMCSGRSALTGVLGRVCGLDERVEGRWGGREVGLGTPCMSRGGAGAGENCCMLTVRSHGQLPRAFRAAQRIAKQVSNFTAKTGSVAKW